jgi:type IV pilus assembly protein PilN
MYSLDINFLKERNLTQKPNAKVKRKIDLGSLTPIWIGSGVSLVLLAIVGGAWWIVQIKTAEVAQQITQYNTEISALDQKIASVSKLKSDVKAAQDEVNALVTVFDRIHPWSALLQDLRSRIPQKVQIESIKQIAAPPPPPPNTPPDKLPENPNGGLEIIGYARSFNDVNDFLLILQQSKFLNPNGGQIITADLIPAPVSNSKNHLQPISLVKYTINVGLTDAPASSLIKELAQEGSTGLVTRLLDIKKTGVITK